MNTKGTELGRAPAVSRGRLTWRKLTLLLFHKPVFSIFGQTDFWFLVFGGPQYLVCYAGASFDTATDTPAINIVGEIRVNPLSDNYVFSIFGQTDSFLVAGCYWRKQTLLPFQLGSLCWAIL